MNSQFIKRNKVLLILVFLLSNFVSFAQLENEFFTDETSFCHNDSSQLILSIKNTNFFKNNEYFNEFVKGYTLIGYFINPRISYLPHKKIYFEFGGHFLKYSGVNDFSLKIPTFRVVYKAGKHFHIVLGNIYGTYNHDLIRPIYHTERYFTDNIENGLQFLVNKPHFKMDTWLNWEQYIFNQSPFQEIFTIGNSSEIVFTNTKKHQVSLPMQAIITHRGGQIDAADGEVESLANTALGLRYNYLNKNTLIQKIQFSGSLVSFADISPNKWLPYINGYGIYSKMFIESKHFALIAGHWYGDMFITTRGEPIFQSISTHIKDYREDKRALIFNQFYFQSVFYKNFIFRAGFTTYFDLYNDTLDYSYQIYISFNQDIIIDPILNALKNKYAN